MPFSSILDRLVEKLLEGRQITRQRITVIGERERHSPATRQPTINLHHGQQRIEMFSRQRRKVIWLVPVGLLQHFCPSRSMEERAAGVCGKPAVPPLIRIRVQPLHGPAMNLHQEELTEK